jgi:hypothetical protein
VRRRYLPRNRFWTGLLPDSCVRVTRSLDELQAAVADFERLGIPVVAGLGGDGSQHHLADALIRHHLRGPVPTLLALPGGTMNGIARGLGNAGPSERLLTSAIAALTRGDPAFRERGLLKVEQVADGRIRHGFSFASGLVYRALEEYYRRPEPGLLDALRASALPLWAALAGGRFYADPRMQLRTDSGASLSEPPHSILASVLHNPLLWFRPFGTVPQPANAFLLAATSLRPRQIAPKLWSLFRGRCRHPRLWIGPCREARVRSETGYLIDGELYRDGRGAEVRITVGPQLRFLVPEAEP